LAESLHLAFWRCTPATREVKTTVSAILDKPPEMLWESQTEIQHTEAIQKEATFIVPAPTQKT
jgi:hypothetical protein